MLRKARKQVGEWYAEHLRHAPEVQDAEVSFAALDRADERSIQPAAFGQLGLRPFEVAPMLPKPQSQFPQEMSLVQVHRLTR